MADIFLSNYYLKAHIGFQSDWNLIDSFLFSMMSSSSVLNSPAKAECNKCKKTFNTDKGLKLHQRMVSNCNKKRSFGETVDGGTTRPVESLFTDGNTPLKKTYDQYANLIGQLVLNTTFLEHDASDTTKIMWLKSNDAFMPTNAKKTIDALSSISTGVNALMRPIIHSMKDVMDDAVEMEKDQYRGFKGLTKKQLLDIKMKMETRVEVINFLLISTDLKEMNDGISFVLDHEADFVEPLVDAVLSPTADSIFS